MFSSAWHSCRASLSRAADCPDRYGAKSRTGISAASLLVTGEGAALIVNIPLSRIGIQPVRFERNCRKARSDHATGIVFETSGYDVKRELRAYGEVAGIEATEAWGL